MKRIPLPRVEAANEPVFDYAQVLTHILLTAPAGRPLPTAAMMARWEVAQKVRRHAGASVLLAGMAGFWIIWGVWASALFNDANSAVGVIICRAR